MFSKRSLVIALSFSVLGFVVACAANKVAETSMAEAAPKPGPAWVEMQTTAVVEPSQSEYSQGLIGREFEEKLAAPILIFENSKSHLAPGSKVGGSCDGKKKNGLYERRWICRDEEGHRIVSISFRKNLKHGWVRERDEKGKLKSESFWQNDALTGYAKTYHDNGKENVVGRFRKNVRDGRFAEYDVNGARIGIFKYEKGKLNGLARSFYPNRNLKRRLTYVEDEPNGEFSSWYENGNIESHGNLKRGTPIGSWHYWNQDGTPAPDRVY